MRDNKYEKLTVISYLVSLFLLPITLILFMNKRINPTYSIKFIILFILCVIMYIASMKMIKRYGYDKSLLKINLIIYFLVYIVIIFNLTLFDEIYGRQGLTAVNWNRELLIKYFNNSFNIVPFRTIKLFINGYNNRVVTHHAFIENIYGNILAFAPFSFFIPLIFKKIDKYYKFIIVMLVIVLQIELLQFITMSGACDIDDVILNLMGATIAYFIFKIKAINKVINKVFLLEEDL